MHQLPAVLYPLMDYCVVRECCRIDRRGRSVPSLVPCARWVVKRIVRVDAVHTPCRRRSAGCGVLAHLSALYFRYGSAQSACPGDMTTLWRSLGVQCTKRLDRSGHTGSSSQAYAEVRIDITGVTRCYGVVRNAQDWRVETHG